MVRNTCPNCGAVTDDRAQNFCTQCGTKLPDLPATAGTSRTIPAWAVAAAGVVAILLLAAVLWPYLAQVVSGTSSSGFAGTGSTTPVSSQADITPFPSAPLPATNIPQNPPTTTTSVAPTPVPTAITTAKTSATTVPVAKVTTVMTAVTASPTPEFTSQITLAVTQIPSQPPSDSYTSKTPGAPYIDPYALETRIHELINIQRQQNGLSTLSYDSFLANIARGHSYDMSLRNFFEHTNPDGMNARARGDWAGYPCVRDYETYYTSGISENLYQGYRYQTYLTAPNGTIVSYNWSSIEFIANQAVNGWMNSEGHRENILDYHFQQEGIGVSFSSYDKIYVTENFC